MKKIIEVGLLGWLIAGLWAVSAAAAEPEWKVGLAHVKITPEQPVFLAGYGGRTRPFDKVTTELYAKALALEDHAGHVAVLVTTDLLGLPKAIAEPICTRLAAQTGLKREQILLSSSHIHTGPALSLSAVPEEGRAPADVQRTIAYTRELQDRLVQVVASALKERTPARLSWGTGVANFVMNRREFTPRGVILGNNPRGPADRTVPVLRIDGPDGKVRAVLFGAATHNTTLTGQCYEICGDYAGFAQSYLQKHQPGALALFLLGFAGDSNPYPRGTMEMARDHGTALGKEVERVLATKLQLVHGPLKIAYGPADLPLAPPPPRDVLVKQAAGKGLQAGIARQMLAVLDHGDKLPTHYSCPVAVWQFGKDLTLVALSGEVVVDYASHLEKALGPNHLWLAAYCNDVFGYLPSARVLAEGGYETRGLYAGGVGSFDPRAQDVLILKIRELAGTAGRPLPAGINPAARGDSP
jgi:neutral ceramidase